MTGDPKVLAGLQQAFNATDDPRIHRLIGNAWEFETASCSTIYPALGDRIRAWTPPAEPSLDDLAFGLSIKFAALSVEMDEMKKRLDALEQHPEPPAPDDPVCAREGCGHPKSVHALNSRVCHVSDCTCHEFLPAPAADLDPVRVEAAAKAIRGDGWGRSWDELNQGHRDSYIRDANKAIRAYLNGETR